MSSIKLFKVISISLLLVLCIAYFVVAPSVDNRSSLSSFEKIGEDLIALNLEGRYRQMFGIQELNEESLKKQYKKVF